MPTEQLSPIALGGFGELGVRRFDITSQLPFADLPTLVGRELPNLIKPPTCQHDAQYILDASGGGGFIRLGHEWLPPGLERRESVRPCGR